VTSKEIIQRVIKLEKTPRLSVSLLSAGAWTLNQSGLTLEQALAVGPQRIAESIAKTNEIVGCDIVWPGSGYHNGSSPKRVGNFGPFFSWTSR